MAAADPSESVIGHTLDGKYRIDELIGRGGMGAVFKAEHVGTGRPVAVKTILPRLVKNLDSIERFRREARAAGSLRHPNIVDVTDFGVATVDGEKVAYLVMEYLEGSTLRAMIEDSGSLSVDVVIDVVEQIALALDTAHRMGIIHRDLKPDNIWLVPDARGGHGVRILDFGIAKLRDTEPPDKPNAKTRGVAGQQDDDSTAIRSEEDLETAMRTAEDLATAIRTPENATTLRTPARQDSFHFDEAPSADDATEVRPHASGTPSAQLTTAGMTLGTPAYMSPEQCRSEDVDARSDVYSLGVVAWQALTGKRPFEGTYHDLLRQHTKEEARSAADVNVDVSRKVADAVAVALAKNPAERYQSAGAMAGSMRVAAEGASVVLRKAAALYIDRFDSFLGISFRAARPALWLILLTALSLPLLGRNTVTLMFLTLAGSVLWGIVTVMTHAVFSTVVERLRSEPLSPLRADAVFADLNRRLDLPDKASPWATLRKLGKFYLIAEMKAPPGMGDLAFQIAFQEGRPPGEVAERCQLLVGVTKKSFDWVRFVILGFIMILPIIEGCVLLTFGQLFRLHPGDLYFAVLVIVMLSLPLIAIVTNPMLSPALAILYFRARQANGEDVGLSAVIPSRL